MKQIHATADGSYKKEPGDHRVLVGVIDTGVDGTHPDIAPNFNRALSRNFTTDIPVDADGNEVDGPCEHPSCVDPVDEDDNEHGTHVASTIASPLNGVGIAGVAPDVSLVNVRAGQDSGFFFLQPVVDALTYSADHGIDVVNMSFYTDPWLFNCTDNPADSPEYQAEQRTIIQASERALGVRAPARRHPGRRRPATVPPTTPRRSLTPPARTTRPWRARRRTPVRSRRPASPSRARARTSSPSRPWASASASPTTPTTATATSRSRRPGGDTYDTAGPEGGRDQGRPGRVPEVAGRGPNGELNPDGTPNVPFVVRSCKGSTLRLLPVPAGHVDGITARDGRGGADRQQVRSPRPRPRRPDPVPGPGRVDPRGHRDRARLPDTRATSRTRGTSNRPTARTIP